LANGAKKVTYTFMFLAKIGLFHTRFLQIDGDKNLFIEKTLEN
jgi:hypothetical protein